MNSIGERLQYLRRKILNISQIKFSEILGIRQPTLSQIESSKTFPGNYFLEKIIKHYPDVSLDWLLSGKGEPLPNQGSGKNQKANEGKNSELVKKISTYEQTIKALNAEIEDLKIDKRMYRDMYQQEMKKNKSKNLN